jgi:adenylate cyclase
VTVLFTDFKGFTASTEHLPADRLVALLHDYFTAFDRIVLRYKLEKLKTIGDSYMCVGGMPERRPSHPVDIVLAGLEMLEAVASLGRRPDGVTWQVRIGVHTGPVVAGVVGIQKFAFDIWGETVNIASRMESSGEPGRINLSPQSYTRVKDFFECEPRGMVPTKERPMQMYFVKEVLSELLGGSNQIPPPEFQTRYQTYFHEETLAFPGRVE